MYERLKQRRDQNNSEIAIALDNLAKLYPSILAYIYLIIIRFALDQKTYTEAEESYRKALEIKKQTLGAGHVYTAITQDHLAQLLVKCQRLDEAELLYHAQQFYFILFF